MHVCSQREVASELQLSQQVATDIPRLEESQKSIEVDILGDCHGSNTNFTIQLVREQQVVQKEHNIEHLDVRKYRSDSIGFHL